jgi:hypothetical protein
LAKETNMNYSPGYGSPVAGYTVLINIIASLSADNRFNYADYGKGVMSWETDAEAAIDLSSRKV